MKTLLLLVIAALSLVARAEEFRIWTQKETGRTLEAKMLDKRVDNSEAKLLMKNGRAVWVKSKTLSDQDQEYIKNWVREAKDILSARVIGSKRGGRKHVEVTVVANAKPLKIVCYGTATATGDAALTKDVEANGKAVFDFWSGVKYRVEAWSGNELVDVETNARKTGAH